MSLLATPVEKAAGALEGAERRLADFQARRTTKVAELNAEADFDKNFAVREDLAGIDRLIAAASDAIEHAKTNLASAEAAEAKAKLDAEERRIQKLATDHAKLVIEIPADSEKLAAKIGRAEAMRKQIDDWNATHVDRAFVADGERKLREIPGREVPAILRREWAWVNSAGERPTQHTERDGKMVPLQSGFGPSGPFDYREVEVVESEARYEPGRMPPRFADSVKLYGLKGEVLWPR